MKSKLFVIFAAGVMALFMSVVASAQSYERVTEKTVRPVKGKKLILNGSVLDGDEVLYRFRARAGQTATVKIIGRDADFSVSLNYGLDAEPVAKEVKTWTGKMPREFDGHCEIAVHSLYKLAKYRLEILLK
jgi:hypothetical protein